MRRKLSSIATAIIVSMLPFAFERSSAEAEVSQAAKPDSSPVAPSSVAQPQSAEEKLIAPWNEMNLSFRDSYAKARRLKIDSLGPVAIFREDKMVLQYKGKREEFVIIPQRFTLLKSVCHISLAVFLILEGKTDRQLDGDTIKTLTAFRGAVEKAARNIDEWKLSPECLARQHKIIDDSNALIESTLKNGTITGDALLAYTRKMGPLVLENSYEAISLELEEIDARFKTWKATIPPEDWKRLKVAVTQPHMPRNDNSICQYLQKMLKQPYEGDRIIYAEGKNEEDYAMDLIGTHILDERVAIDFFKDPWRMHRDLLSDGARRYLKKHRPLN